jgi:hypothetical protein
MEVYYSSVPIIKNNNVSIMIALAVGATILSILVTHFYKNYKIKKEIDKNYQ